VTRAKEYLYLLHTFRRTLYGESEVREPSRFLQDIPEHLIRGRQGQPQARQPTLAMGAGRFLGQRPASPLPAWRKPQPASEAPQPPAPSFQTGDQVQHELFGNGIVIDSKPEGQDERVTVAFAGVGIKKLMASMSPMEKVEGGD
jgi:DNA helicase-2/ATP-dependent DNA helicase PcrA